MSSDKTTLPSAPESSSGDALNISISFSKKKKKQRSGYQLKVLFFVWFGSFSGLPVPSEWEDFWQLDLTLISPVTIGKAVSTALE